MVVLAWLGCLKPMPEIHGIRQAKGSHLIMVAALLISLAIGATAFLVLDRIESATRESVGHTLETVLEVTHNALEYWRTTQTKLIQHELNDRSLRDLIVAQLDRHRVGMDLFDSPALEKLRRRLQPIIDEFGYQGFFVIAPDRISIGSMRDSNIGTTNLLTAEGDFLERVFKGETLFSKVVVSDVPLPDSEGRLAEEQPTMFVATPVPGDEGEVVAVLTFRIAPAQDFTRIARLGRIGETGETYFFNLQGQIVSETRFDDEVHEIGLLEPGEPAVLHLELRDPGGDMSEGFQPYRPRHEQPLTEAAAEALAGHAGANLRGYRDYRGRVVIGAWRPPHGSQDMGVVTEIDKAEAYGVYNLTRRLLLVTVAMAILLLLVLAATLTGGHRRALALAEEMTQKLRRSERYFQHLARISQVVSHASDMDSMMVSVAQEIRRTFQVDSAWLIYPCDPNASSWQLPVEARCQDCPGDSGKTERLMDPLMASVMRRAVEASGPIACDFSEAPDMPGCLGVAGKRNQLCVALRPKLGRPWLLGLCQCSSQRQWNEDEYHLLREIGGRISNACTNLLLLDELENALQERKSIMDTVPDVLVTLDPEGRLVDWNNSLERTTGLTCGELRQRSIKEIICDEDHGVVATAIERCLKEGYTATEARLVKKGVGLIPFYWVAASRKDQEGKVISISGSGRDITESKQAQEAVRQSEARLAKAQRIARLGNWEWDVEANSLYWSDEVYRIFGLSPEEFEASYEAFLERVYPDDRADVEQAIKVAFEQHGGYSIDHRILLPDGAVRIVNEQAEVVYDGEGRPVRMLGTVHDITERKLAAEELRRHRDHLQEMVEEQTADLKAAKEAAEAANQAKTEFLANMSHELRTPMHAILSFASIGEEKAGASSPARLQGYFSRIHQSGQRLLTLLNDLLDLSKLEAGRMEFSMVEHDMRTVLTMAVAEFKGLLSSKSLTLELVPSEVDTRASFDSGKLLQVLRNLLSNAIKFTPDGGWIRVSFADASLPSGPAIEVRVEDGGVGIPEDELESVFDKFMQSSKTKTGAGGTGLGLAICKEIIEGHGGTIWAENVPDDGARLVFRIPRQQAG
jgi:PAS domain S-box-containing protein